MILEAKNINKSYSNGSKYLSVLENINLEIDSGEIITLIGPSGSGKSTLLNILGTLDIPDSGTLKILGNDVGNVNDERLARIRNRHIGFVFQFHHLLPEFTAFENVMIPARIKGNYKQKIDKAMDLFRYVGIEDRYDHFPSQLSGGERLRVAVLRALINQPDLILADEPTGNLDHTNAQKLLDLFVKICKDFNQSIILTTHNLQVAGIGHKKYELVNHNLKLLP